MHNLRKIRLNNNLYQKDIAKYLNKSITCISDWERNRTEPDIDSLKKLADFYQCSINYIIGRENEDYIIKINNNLTNAENQLIDTVRKLNNNNKELIYAYSEFLIKEQNKHK